MGIIKHSYIRTDAGARGRARAHVNYIQFRAGVPADGAPMFFNETPAKVSGLTVQKRVASAGSGPVVIHKLIVSPDPEYVVDVKDLTRHLMDRLSHAKALDLEWYAIDHHNTDVDHAHVIVLGKDRSGRNVRFNRYDYDYLRKLTDSYVGKIRDMDRTLESELVRRVSDARRKDPTARETMQRLASCTSGFFDRFFGARDRARADYIERHRKRYQRAERLGVERRSRTAVEALILGPAAPPRRLRDPKHLEPTGTKPRHPRSIVWYRERNRSPWSRVELTPTSDIRDLKELARLCETGAQRLTTPQRKLLDSWIADREHQTRMLNFKARRITRIEIDHGGTEPVTYTKQSSQSSLRSLLDRHNNGEIVLKDEEARAITMWLMTKQQRNYER